MNPAQCAATARCGSAGAASQGLRLLCRASLVWSLLVLFSTSAHAAAYTLPADIGQNGSPFKDCSGAGPAYTCTGKVDIKNNDTVVLTSDVTLNLTGNNEFKVGGGSVNNSGFVFNVTAGKIHIDGPGPVIMDELVASGDIIIHKQSNVTGNITSTGGDIDIEDGNNTINGNIDAQSGDVNIEGGNNTVNGNITADNGNGNLDIDNTSIVSGTCNPDHPQCNGGPGGGPGGSCTTEQIAGDGEEFRGIHGVSDDDIYAVGKDGSIYHYDGTSWSKTFDSGDDLNSVYMVSSNLGYAVGKDGDVFEFDGTTWTQLTAPTGEDLNDVWAASANEVWVVGKKDALYRWNGASWDDMSGNGEADVDNNQELESAWGDASVFYALEKDGDLYRYARPTGPWTKVTECEDTFDMDVNDIWGDGTGNIYIAGKNKDTNPDEATVFVYNEGTDSCSVVFSTDTENDLDSVYGNGSTIYAVGKDGLVLDNSSGSWTESVEGTEDFEAVWVSSSNTAYYAGKNGELTTCTPVSAGLDHFVITPASFNPSTCLANAVTIRAEDDSNNTITDYTGTVSISTSTNHGNWSTNMANGTLSPDPDTDDNGAVSYTFDLLDEGEVILDLANTHAETLIITVSEGGVSTNSAAITYGDNVFVLTEEAVQVAGRPMSIRIQMFTNDGTNCFQDTNYNYDPQTIEFSIDRAGVLPGANDPSIGGTTIVETPGVASIDLDFQTTPGETTVSLDSTDVGQFRVIVTDNSLVHSDLPITGSSNVITLAPFGIAMTNLIDTATSTPNPGATAAGGAIFTTAAHDLTLTVAGVLWSAADDTNNDGVLDTGVYANNTVAPSYAWDTSLDVSTVVTSYTPSPGTPGTLRNSNVLEAAFTAGSTTITDLQYTEVGSFTLQAEGVDYLGVTGRDFVGDDIIVGRFIPAAFEVSVVDDGELDDACGIYTYLGEEFSYATAPRLAVSAVNALGDITLQYRDAFVKLDGGSVGVAVSQDDSTTGTDAMPLDVAYSAAAMGFAAQNNGIVNYTFGADAYRYGPDAPLGEFSKAANSLVAPFVADINPEITQVDDGEVSSVYASGTYELDPTGNNPRFGRLRMDNVHGSELNALVMPVFTEYWNGFNFQKNTLDTCTTIATANLSSTASPAGLSSPVVVNSPASAGDVNYSYAAPGAGNTGFVDTTTDLNAAAHLWLRYDWDADGDFDDDPSARATFGIFEGNPVQIYIQQIFQ